MAGVIAPPTAPFPPGLEAPASLAQARTAPGHGRDGLRAAASTPVPTAWGSPPGSHPSATHTAAHSLQKKQSSRSGIEWNGSDPASIRLRCNPRAHEGESFDPCLPSRQLTFFSNVVLKSLIGSWKAGRPCRTDWALCQGPLRLPRGPGRRAPQALAASCSSWCWCWPCHCWGLLSTAPPHPWLADCM